MGSGVSGNSGAWDLGCRRLELYFVRLQRLGTLSQSYPNVFVGVYSVEYNKPNTGAYSTRLAIPFVIYAMVALGCGTMGCH